MSLTSYRAAPPRDHVDREVTHLQQMVFPPFSSAVRFALSSHAYHRWRRGGTVAPDS